MNTKITFLFIIIILLSTTSSSASYVQDGNIVILRSQYKNSNNEITIDGVLGEDDWNKAGLVSISFVSNDTTGVQVRFFNDDYYLYFSISVTYSDTVIEDSIAIYFDVDSDGQLSTPEDAKILRYVSNILSAEDYYWDGDTWKNDELDPVTDTEFKAAAKKSINKITYEIAIVLTSTNFQYDGFQIPSPTNSFVAFTLKIGKSISVNETIYLFYPTTEDNSSGYVDLKLAGPEDQDLPEYIPPVTQTYTQDPTITIEEEGAAVVKQVSEDADSPFPIISLFVTLILAISIKRRRKY